MRRFLVSIQLALAIAGTAALTACAEDSTAPGVAAALAAGPHYIRGEITTRDHPWGYLVKGEPGKPNGETQAHFRLQPTTVIVHADGSPGTVAELTPGRTIRLWITGIVMESLPVQVSATLIVLES